MSGIKILNKKMLNNLQATLTLRLGRKISQQETLDLCLRYAVKDFEDLVKFASNVPTLTPEIAEEIIALFEEDDSALYDINTKFPNPDDQEIHSL